MLRHRPDRRGGRRGGLRLAARKTAARPDDAPAGAAFDGLSTDLNLEYGLTGRVTVGAKLFAGLRLDAGDRERVATDVAGFAHCRLWRGDDGAVPRRGRVQVPLDDVAATPALSEDGTELRVALPYGRGFESPLGPGWADTAAGLARFTGERVDQATLDATLGVRPAEGWIAIAQALATFGLGDAHVLIGVGRDVHARGIDPGTEVTLTLWRSF